MRKVNLLVLGAFLALTITLMTMDAHGAAGSLDPTFGSGGVSTLTVPGNGLVGGIVQQPDGKIVVEGSFGAARVLPSGAIDKKFGVSGFAQPPASGGFRAVALQSDGKILLQQPDGKILLGGELIEPDNDHPVLIRYDLNGNLDTTFGSGGSVNTIAVPVQGVKQLALDLQGDIFVNDAFFIAEFNSSGVQLPQVTPALLIESSRGGATTFLSNGQYYFAEGVCVGPCRNRDNDSQVVRFTATGAIDSTFNSPTFDFVGEGGSGQFDFLSSIAVQSNGQVVVAGGHFTISTNNSVFGIARFNTNGRFDLAFGNSGTVTTVSTFQGASALLIQSDGKIVAAGTHTSGGLVLARYLAQ